MNQERNERTSSLRPSELRSFCDRLNPGGQSKLARLLGWNHSTFWRKLNGKSRITESDALAISKALEIADEP
jgi:hypothetical protein